MDVLVTFAPGVEWPFEQWAEMVRELEGIFGRKVDLVECRLVEESRNYIRRRHILNHLEKIYVGDEAYLLDCQSPPERPKSSAKVSHGNSFAAARFISMPLPRRWRTSVKPPARYLMGPEPLIRRSPGRESSVSASDHHYFHLDLVGI